MVATEALKEFLKNGDERDKAIIDHELMSKTFEETLESRLVDATELYNAWNNEE